MPPILASQVYTHLMHQISRHLVNPDSYTTFSQAWTEKIIATMDQHHVKGFRETITIDYRHFKHSNNLQTVMQRFRAELRNRFPNEEVIDVITHHVRASISEDADRWVLGMATGINNSGSILPRDDGTVLVYGFCGNVRYNCTYPYYLRGLGRRHYQLSVTLDGIAFRWNPVTSTIYANEHSFPI